MGNAAARRRKNRNRNGRGILRKEDEKIPVGEIMKRIKRKRAALSSEEDEEVLKRMEEKIPLADFYNLSRKRSKLIEEEDVPAFYKMSGKRPKSIHGDTMNRKRAKSIEEEDDGDITVIELFRNFKRKESRRIPISLKKIFICPKKDKEEEKIFLRSSPNDSDDSSGLDEEELSVEDSEEEKKFIRRSPVANTRICDYINLDQCGFDDIDDTEDEQFEQEESDEELVYESDFHEVDWDAKFVLRKRWRTITNPKFPERIYFRHHDADFINHNVLHDPEFPLVTLSKSALDIYNAIQETEYEFVGLVKANMQAVAGFSYTIRFKARLHAQDAINFQASIYQEVLRRRTKVIPVHVHSVYPLPPC